MIEVTTIKFGKELIDPTISFEDLSSHLEQIFKFFEHPEESKFQSISRFTFANAIVLINKTQFENRDQIELIAKRFNDIGQSLKKIINPHYYACLGVTEYLNRYLSIYDQLNCSSFNDVQNIREAALKERAEKIVDALKQIAPLKEELCVLESQGQSAVSVPVDSVSTGGVADQVKQFLLKFLKRSNIEAFPKRDESEIDKKINIINKTISSNISEYSFSDMQEFLFTCGHKEENFKIVTDFFSVIDPFLSGSHWSKEPHVRLLIDTISSITQKHGISLNDSKEYNDYLNQLCTLGVNWLENGKSMSGFVSLARNLRKITARIGLEQEISETLAEMTREAKPEHKKRDKPGAATQ